MTTESASSPPTIDTTPSREGVVEDVEAGNSNTQRRQSSSGAAGASSPPTSPRTPKSTSSTTPTSLVLSPTSPSSRRGSANTGTIDYPRDFYCPITKQLLKDPVVLADGLSYERSAILERNNENTTEGEDNTEETFLMYSNRSLKTIVEDSTSSKKTTLFEKAKQLLVADDIRTRPLSDGFYCPITLGLMHVPVIDPQGYTYEQVAIENWIRVNGDSPVTRETLSLDQLVPNRAIENLLQTEASKKDESQIHPAIRKWKQEPPPVVRLELDTENANNTTNADALADATGAANGTRDPEANETVAHPIMERTSSFPLTPEEFRVQQQHEERIKRFRMVSRLSLLVICLAVLVLGFYFPFIAAIALVVIILGICTVTQDAARMDEPFRS